MSDGEKVVWEFTVGWLERVSDHTTPVGWRTVCFGKLVKYDDHAKATASRNWHLTHDDWMPLGASDPEVSPLYERTVHVGDDGRSSSTTTRFADPPARANVEAARAGIASIRSTLASVKNPGPLFGGLAPAARVPGVKREAAS